MSPTMEMPSVYLGDDRARDFVTSTCGTIDARMKMPRVCVKRMDTSLLTVQLLGTLFPEGAVVSFGG